MTTNEADWSKHRFYKQDPLPGIKPALLNSLDIKRYVDEGCLLEKDSFDPRRMKPASYEMRFLGELYDWQKTDGRLQKRCRKVSVGDCIELSKNSISYLWMQERLRLPDYVAARFNLRISDVHKGLLLGTGPLIDPGFGGRILVPLHNLTDNDYVLRGGDGIIWVEFTKVSQNRYWLPGHEDAERPEGLVAFPSGKVIEDPLVYLNKSGVLDAGGVQSAFKGALDRARADAGIAQSASKRVDDFERTFKNWGFVGLFVGAVAVAGLVVSAYQLSIPAMKKVHSLEKRLEQVVEARSKAPIFAPTEEARNKAEDTASKAAQAAEAAETRAEPEQSPASEVAQ